MQLSGGNRKFAFALDTGMKVPVVSAQPLSVVAINLTGKFPVVLKVYDGFWALDELPSLKVHLSVKGLLEIEESLKTTCTGG
jgi:hypothetical protein